MNGEKFEKMVGQFLLWFCSISMLLSGIAYIVVGVEYVLTH